MDRMLSILLLIFVSVSTFRSEVIFESLCSSEVEVRDMLSIDGSDEFEIDLYENKFLPDDTLLCKFLLLCSTESLEFYSSLVSIKQKRQNYGINEFVIRAFDYDNNVIGRFDDRQTGNLALKHHTCPNGASVS